MRTRFAPSPTGYLHIGHALSAFFVWGIAKAYKAEVILRIEDHDRDRSRKEYEESIFRDLEWLGLQPDYGVSSVHECSIYRQSDCVTDYEQMLSSLQAQNLIYACECTRKGLSTNSDGTELHYPGTCRNKHLPIDLKHTIRLKLSDFAYDFVDGIAGKQNQDPNLQCGDFSLRDRNGCYTYQACVSHDDVKQGINLIIRGQDLLASTARQEFLKAHIQQGIQTHYFHHPLIKDNSGKKLSKRFLSEGMHKYREQGTSRAVFIREICELSGISELQGISDFQGFVRVCEKLISPVS